MSHGILVVIRKILVKVHGRETGKIFTFHLVTCESFALPLEESGGSRQMFPDRSHSLS